MAQASLPRSPARRQTSTWPRRHRRRWLRANTPDAAGAMMAVMPSLPRSVLARLVEQMIQQADDTNDEPAQQQEQAYE